MKGLALSLALAVSLLAAGAAAYPEDGVLFREEFHDLESWSPVHFPKIKKHTAYSVAGGDEGGYLRAESDSSASGMLCRLRFNVYDYPRVRWRWKVSNVYQKGDARNRAGDDYPARVYVVFQYNPEDAGLFERMRYALARAIYGQYPPRSSLNYIWANRLEKGSIAENAYTGRSMMIALESGEEKAGRWVEEEIDILSDYRRAFGEDPPPTAAIAFMNDSDNTGESSVSWLDYIEVRK